MTERHSCANISCQNTARNSLNGRNVVQRYLPQDLTHRKVEQVLDDASGMLILLPTDGSIQSSDIWVSCWTWSQQHPSQSGPRGRGWGQTVVGIVNNCKQSTSWSSFSCVHCLFVYPSGFFFLSSLLCCQEMGVQCSDCTVLCSSVVTVLCSSVNAQQGSATKHFAVLP